MLLLQYIFKCILLFLLNYLSLLLVSNIWFILVLSNLYLFYAYLIFSKINFFNSLKYIIVSIFICWLLPKTCHYISILIYSLYWFILSTWSPTMCSMGIIFVIIITFVNQVFPIDLITQFISCIAWVVILLYYIEVCIDWQINVFSSESSVWDKGSCFPFSFQCWHLTIHNFHIIVIS